MKNKIHRQSQSTRKKILSILLPSYLIICWFWWTREHIFLPTLHECGWIFLQGLNNYSLIVISEQLVWNFLSQCKIKFFISYNLLFKFSSAMGLDKRGQRELFLSFSWCRSQHIFQFLHKSSAHGGTTGQWQRAVLQVCKRFSSA